MGKSPRRALVKGRRADFWFYEGAHVFLRHPNGRDEDEVPVAHLRDDAAMREHYRRLAGKDWVSRGAIEELREMAEGAFA